MKWILLLVGLVLLMGTVSAAIPELDYSKWWNSETGDNQTSLTIDVDESTYFQYYINNATQYNWTDNSSLVTNNSFYVFQKTWDTPGTYTINVSAGNSDGWSNTINCTVTVTTLTDIEIQTNWYNPHNDELFGLEFASAGKNSLWIYGDNWVAFEINPQLTTTVSKIDVMIAEQWGTLPTYKMVVEYPNGTIAWAGAENTSFNFLEMRSDDAANYSYNPADSNATRQMIVWDTIELDTPGTMVVGQKYRLNFSTIGSTGDKDNSVALRYLPSDITAAYEIVDEGIYFNNETYISGPDQGYSQQFSDGITLKSWCPVYFLHNGTGSYVGGQTYFTDVYPTTSYETIIPPHVLNIDSVAVAQNYLTPIIIYNVTYSNNSLIQSLSEQKTYSSGTRYMFINTSGHLQLLPSETYRIQKTNTGTTAFGVLGQNFIVMGISPNNNLMARTTGHLTWGGTAWDDGSRVGEDMTMLLHLSPVIGNSPQSTSVEIDKNIYITFSRDINHTAAENAFEISPIVTGVFTWNGSNNNTMIFTPNSNFTGNTSYTVTINPFQNSTPTENEQHPYRPWNMVTELRVPYEWSYTTGSAWEAQEGHIYEGRTFEVNRLGTITQKGVPEQSDRDLTDFFSVVVI